MQNEETAARHLEQALSALEEAVEALGRAMDVTPAYAVDSLRFLRAELKVARRRAENVRRALGSTTDRPPAA